jgi:serine/threonine protein kinase
MDNRIVLQNLNKSTVQVRDETNKIVGTAFVLKQTATDCFLVSTKQVIDDAIASKQRQANAKVRIYFPQTNETKDAVVNAYAPDPDDDIVILKAKAKANAYVQAAKIASGLDYAVKNRHSFKSFGYRYEEDSIDGVWVAGEIIGTILPHDSKLSIPLLELRSSEITAKMRGFPILDLKRNLVIGMIRSNYPSKDDVSPITAYAVDLSAISMLSKDIVLESAPELPLETWPIPVVEENADSLSRKFPLDPSWSNAPELKTRAERRQLLSTLDSDWNNSSVHLVSLVGDDGVGKKSLVRDWLGQIEQDGKVGQGLIWLDFYDEKDTQTVIDKILRYLTPESTHEAVMEYRPEKKINLIAQFIRNYKLVFVLINLHHVQHEEEPLRGQIKDRHLTSFLRFFLLKDIQSFCVVTSRLPLVSEDSNPYSQFSTFQSHEVGGISWVEVNAWLQKFGSGAPQTIVKELLVASDVHAFLLGLVMAEIKATNYASVNALELLKKLSKKEVPPEDIGISRVIKIQEVFSSYFKSTALSDDERTLLVLVAAFGEPISIEALPFIQKHAPENIKELSKNSLKAIVESLINRSLLRKAQNNFYYTHPLIVDECRKILEQYTEPTLSDLRFAMALFYFSRNSATSGIVRSQDTEQGLRYLYLALDLQDKLDLQAFKYGALPEDVLSREEILENGKYIIISKLGSGAAGDLLVAYERSASRLVAIKRIKPEFLDYLGEIELLPQLRHTYIIPINLVIVDTDPKTQEIERIFLVMPYFPEGSLYQQILTKRENDEVYSLQEISRILNCIAEGLDYLHGLHVVHQDIKPQNIVFDGDEPIIIDFGFAKIKQDDLAKSSIGDDAGTPKYISPEKSNLILYPDAKPHPEIGGASDQYSVAIIIYEMLTGHMPYGNRMGYELLEDHITKAATPPSTLRKNLPKSVDSVLLRALSKNPNERYPTMEDFATEFALAIYDVVEEEPQEGVHWILPISILLGIAALIIAVIVGWNSCQGDCPPTETAISPSSTSLNTPETILACCPPVTQLASATSSNTPQALIANSTNSNTPQAPSATVPPRDSATSTTPPQTPTATLTATASPTSSNTAQPPTSSVLVVPSAANCEWTNDIRLVNLNLVEEPPSEISVATILVPNCLIEDGETEEYEGSPFIIAAEPVSNRHYLKCMNEAQRKCSRPITDTVYRGEPNPVVGLTWSQANDFCIRIGGRLPSLEEWSYASANISNMGILAEWTSTDGPVTGEKIAISNAAQEIIGVFDTRIDVAFRCAFDSMP